MFLDSTTLCDVCFGQVLLEKECFWCNNSFWICGSSFQQAFKLLLVPFASLDLDVQYSGIRLNLFSEVSIHFYNRFEFVLEFRRLLKETLAFGHVFDVKFESCVFMTYLLNGEVTPTRQQRM